MHLTKICDNAYQKNICKFATLLFICPYACYLTLLIFCSFTQSVKISRTASRVEKNSFFWKKNNPPRFCSVFQENGKTLFL